MLYPPHPLQDLTHRGWTLHVDHIDTPDDRYTQYTAINGAAVKVLDWSGRKEFQPHHFAIMVDAGFPMRATPGVPMWPADVDALALQVAA